MRTISSKRKSRELTDAALTSKYFWEASLNFPLLWSSFPCQVKIGSINTEQIPLYYMMICSANNSSCEFASGEICWETGELQVQFLIDARHEWSNMLESQNEFQCFDCGWSPVFSASELHLFGKWSGNQHGHALLLSLQVKN